MIQNGLPHEEKDRRETPQLSGWMRRFSLEVMCHGTDEGEVVYEGRQAILKSFVDFMYPSAHV